MMRSLIRHRLQRICISSTAGSPMVGSVALPRDLQELEAAFAQSQVLAAAKDDVPVRESALLDASTTSKIVHTATTVKAAHRKTSATHVSDILLHSTLKRDFGLESFRDNQLEVVQAVTSGQDCLVVMPTGSGKSLCFQLPAVALGGTTVVVSPLIALMKDQVDSLCAKGIRATFINSSLTATEVERRIATLKSEQWELVYVAPERFNEHFLQKLRAMDVRLLAIDEAHCVSKWGHDFRPSYRHLDSVRESLGFPPTICLTATATESVQADILESLGLPHARRFIQSFDRPNLSLSVVQCDPSSRSTTNRGPGNPWAQKAMANRTKLSKLPMLLPAEGSTIVYCSTRTTVEKLCESLRYHGAVMYHAGMSTADRANAQEAFLSGQARVMVATNAFGMGVDKSDVRCVVHFEVPGSIEAYYQEVGRAGRDGMPSDCYMLYSEVDLNVHRYFLQGAHPTVDSVQSVHDAVVRACRKADQGPVFFFSLEHFVKNNLDKSTAKAIAGSRGVSTCLRILEESGALRRIHASRQTAVITPNMSGVGAPPKGIRGKVYATLLKCSMWSKLKFSMLSSGATLRSSAHRDYYRPSVLAGQNPAVKFSTLAVVAGQDPAVVAGQEVTIQLDNLAKLAGVTRAQLMPALAGLQKRSWISYTPPSRHGGVEILTHAVGVPQQALPLLSVSQQKELEERRHNAMQMLESVIHFSQAECRRAFILKYFGESPTFVKCNCDRCM